MDASTDWFWEDKIMGLTKLSVLLLIFILFTSSTIVEATWQEPQVIISGGWGNRSDQFGIEYGDSGDTFPREIIVLANGDIWIPDGLVNERLKLYDSAGNLKKTIVLDKATRTFSEYWFVGKFVALGSDGSIYMSNYMGKSQYAQYSPTGQLIRTYTTKPPELGVVSDKALAEDQYKITIKYPDKTYELTSDATFMRYVRDSAGKINAVNPGGVWKFSSCGKEIAELLMPKPGTESVPVTGLKVQNIISDVECGEPVVAPTGDVYTWKKTQFKYSILKWTWQDDSTVPSGPDAPSGLTVTPSTKGLYLAWTASAQDPGCVTGYEIARATTSGGVFSTVGTVDKGVVKYNDTSAEVGTMYYYKVRAKAGTEYSVYAKETSGKR